MNHNNILRYRASLLLFLFTFQSTSIFAFQNINYSKEFADLENGILKEINLDSLKTLIQKELGDQKDNVDKRYLVVKMAMLEAAQKNYDLVDELLQPILLDSVKTQSTTFCAAVLLKAKTNYNKKKYYEVVPFCQQWLRTAEEGMPDYQLRKSEIYSIFADAISWQYEHPRYYQLCQKYYSGSFEAINEAVEEHKNDLRYVNHYRNIGSEYGTVLGLTGQEIAAIRHSRNLLSFLKANNVTEFSDFTTIYFALGLSYSKVGDYENSNLYLDKLIDHLEENPDMQCEGQYGIKLSYKTLNCLWSGDYELGIKTGKKALRLDPCIVRAAKSMLHNNIGHCYADNMNFDEAIIHLDSSIVYGSYPDTFYYNVGIPTRTKAILYNNFQMYEEAIAMARIAYDHFRKIKNEKEYMVCEGILARAYLGIGQLDSSEYYLVRNLKKLGFDNVDNFNVKPRNYADNTVEYLIDFASLQDSFYQRTNKIEYAIKMQKAYDDVFEFIDYRISNINSDKSVLTFLNRFNGLTEKCIESDISLYKLTDDKKYLFAAIDKADRHKSKLAIRNNLLLNKELFVENNKDVHEEWKLFNEEHRKVFNKMLVEKDPATLDELKNEQFLIKDKIDKLESNLKDNNAIYNVYQAAFDKEDYGKKLANGELTLLLFEGEKTLHSFFITSSDAGYLPIEWKNETKELLKEFSASNINASSLDFTNKISEILQPIFDKLEDYESINYLSIIPDGYLNLIPFELLKYKKENLLDQYVISYIPSLKIRSMNKRSSNAEKTLACFVPEYDKSQNKYASANDQEIYSMLVRSGEYELPGARSEAEAIQQIIEGKSYLGKEAIESNFRAKASDHSILHLAMHAYGDHSEPQNSKLIFTQTNEGEEDNYLHMHELLNLELNADLVVLSACSTGAGKVEKGEGVLSLSKAFTAAGVGSVVHSLWKVPDQATSHIMIDFYKNLKIGQRKDEALQNAKLSYLTNESIPQLQKTPYHWAGFVVTGDMSPLSFTSPWSIFHRVGGAVVLLLCFFFFLKFKSK